MNALKLYKKISIIFLVIFTNNFKSCAYNARHSPPSCIGFSSMMSKNIATLIGLSAILQWSSIVGLLKKISASIGADLAVTCMYTGSTIILLLIFGMPNLKKIPRGYFIAATLLFLVYELCFSYAIALAENAQQALEVSLVNYLWPSMTVAMLILFKQLAFNRWVIVGLIVSFSGVIYIQTGNGRLDWHQIFANIESNPVSYLLAFFGAALWAVYCAITKKYSQGHNPIAFFFLAVTVVLWLKTAFLHPIHSIPNVEFSTLGYMLAVSIVTALGYAAWNIGINHGNISMLVTLSYFSPIFSSLISMWILNIQLSQTFWHGAILVTAGSFICWLSTNWQQVKTKIWHQAASQI